MQTWMWQSILLLSCSLHFSSCLCTHFSRSAAPVEVWSAQFTPAPFSSSSVAPSHTSLHITPSVHLPLQPLLSASDGDQAVAKATAAIVYPVARWPVTVAMMENFEAPSPLPLSLPALPLLPWTYKSPAIFPLLCCCRFLPPNDTGGRKACRPLSGAKQRRRDRMDDGLFVLISQISLFFLPLSFSASNYFFLSPFIHLICPVFPSLITLPFHLWLPPYFSILFTKTDHECPKQGLYSNFLCSW